jgi:hypothetical protein
MLPGCVPTACVQGMVCEQGRAHGCKRGLKGRTSCQSEEDLITPGQSDWLIVLGDGESPLQGEAASRRWTDRGHHERHAKGGNGPLCKERSNQSCHRDSRG